MGATALSLLAYLLMFVGLVGSILPIVPGPLLIWLGAWLWAKADGFQAVGWPTLAVLGLLMVVAWGSDLALTTLNSRRAGAGWKSVIGAILGGIGGSLLLSGLLPILGTLLGAMVGGVAGLLAIEYLDKRSWQPALRASRAYILGFVAASALEFLLAIAMIAIFAWQAF